MMKIKATFKGLYPSLGYEPGKEYILVIHIGSMNITREDRSGFCPYASLSAFFSNWTNVTHVE